MRIYGLTIQYQGRPNADIDAGLARLVGQPQIGSGFDLMAGTRDVLFTWEAAGPRAVVVARLQPLTWITLYTWEDDGVSPAVN